MNYFSTVFLSLLTSICIAQVSPPNLNFIEIEEEWRYIYFDTNFSTLSEDPTASPYSHRVPVKYLIDDDYMYLLESKIAPNPYVGIEGSLLHKLNMTTGLTDWVEYNTSFLDLDYRIDITNGELFLEDNTITMTGYRDLETIDYTKPSFSFYGTPMYRSVNVVTGELVDEKHGENTPSGLGYSVTGPGNKIIKSSDEQYISISGDISFTDSIINNLFKFHELDQELDYIYPITDSINYNNGLASMSTQESFRPLFQIHNKDKMLCLFGSKNPESSELSPSELYLKYYDISNLESVSEMWSTDVVDDVYYPQDQFSSSMKLRVKNDNIILYQELFFPTDSPEPNNEFVWLSWYDIAGNRMAQLDPIHIEDRYYPSITVIGVIDESLYIAGGYRENSTEGYDIIKIVPGINDYSRVGTLAISNSPTIDFGISQAEILSNGDLFAAIGLVYRFDSADFNFNYYYRFDGSTLGIITNTKDEELSQTDLLLYPNPAKENIKLEFDKKVRGQLKLVNSVGQEVHTSSLDLISEYQLDLTLYPSGIYTIIFIDELTNVVQKYKFIVVD